MGEPDLSSYLQSLGTTLTVVVLFDSFIFTTLTLVLLQIADVASVLAQATLLLLIIALALSTLSITILVTRIQLLSRPMSKARLPSTPGWRLYNPLILSTILLMIISINLMVFHRGLTELGLVSAAINSVSLAAYIVYIAPFRLTRDQDNAAQ